MNDEEPGVEEVFDALSDDACRTIVEALDEPMTTNQISEVCDMPLSTTYKKIDKLDDATLVEESVQLREDGKHTNTYVVDFDEVCAELTEEHRIAVEVSKQETKGERLERMWEEVREET